MERKEAVSLGLVKYSTGRKCKHGHRSDRSTITGACYECMRVANRKARDAAKKAIKEAQE